MPRPGLADRRKIADWADTRQAQGELPRLVRRLILETTRGLVELGMPAGDGIAARDWDGSVRASQGNAWVPDGHSVWELSVDSSPGAKATSDFEKRGDTPDGSPTTGCTYVELILRPWTGRAQWAKDRRTTGTWRDVRAYGLDDLEAWLEAAPVTWAWLSEELGLTPYGMRTASSWWDSWASLTTPALTPSVVTAGRENTVRAVLDRVGSPGVFTIGGASLDETCAFIAATAVHADANGDGRMLARVAFVNEISTWRHLLDAPEPLVLVPLNPEFAREVPGRSPHSVLVPVAGSKIADLNLPPLDASAVADALKKAGVDDERHSDRAGRLARRSLTAMRRHLAANRALHRPPWAEAPVQRRAKAVLLAGSWDHQRDGDRSALEQFAGESYESLTEGLNVLADASDPLIILVGTTWHLVSAYDAWLLLAEHLTDDDLRRFESAVLAVIGEDDPALDIPQTERWWKATFEGKIRENSGDLRRGLARSLALLGAHGDSLTLSSGSGTAWANHIVRQLLARANDDSSGRRWASLSDVLPLLAEAGPDAFLDAITKGLSGDHPVIATMFTDRDADAFSASSHHTGLLWAIEGLAWSPDHFGEAVEQLARLVEVDPGGRLANRPANSLAAVFCPWHPENAVGRERWFAVIDALRRRHGEAAWGLLMSMLPEFHATHFPTHEPEFRDWKSAPVAVLNSDYFATISAVVERSIVDAGTDIVRWGELVRRVSELPPSNREMVIAALDVVVNGDGLTDEDRSSLWDTIREMVDRHREFPDAEWSLSAEALEPLDRVVEKLRPRGALQRSQWLFQDHMPRLEGVSRREDHAAYEVALAERRRNAVAEIDQEGGLGAVRALAHAASVPWSVGIALAQAKPDYDRELLDLLASDDRIDVDLGGQYFFERFRQAGWEWLDALLPTLPQSRSLAKARLLLATRDVPKAWEVAQQQGTDVEDAYWSHFSTFGLGHDFQFVEHVARKLQGVGRFAVSVDFLMMYRNGGESGGGADAELVAQALEGLLHGPHDAEIRSLSSYDFEQAFSLLESNRDHLGVDRVAALEWGFLPALGYDPAVPALHEGMAENPEFFVEVVCAVYHSRDGDDSESGESESLEQRQGRARNGYHLLSSWSTPPGIRAGLIDPNQLRSWVQSAESLLSERGRLDVGRVHIGHVLATAPPDPDGTWPPFAVRDLLQDARNEEIESGFVTEILNSRGVTSRGLEDGGSQEIALAQKYRADADRFADEWPRVASLLRSVARSYEADARRNEDSAERFRRGID